MNNTQNNNAETVRSTDWLGEAPEKMPVSEGWRWWWDNLHGAWCVVRIVRIRWELRACAMWLDGGMGFVVDAEREGRWGEWIAVPGDSPSVELSNEKE